MNMTSRMAQSRPTTAPPITAVNKCWKHFKIIRLNVRIKEVECGGEHQEQQPPHIHTYKTQDIPKCIGACFLCDRPCGRRPKEARSSLFTRRIKRKRNRRGNPSMIELANGGNNWPEITRETVDPFCAAHPVLFFFPRKEKKNKTTTTKWDIKETKEPPDCI